MAPGETEMLSLVSDGEQICEVLSTAAKQKLECVGLTACVVWGGWRLEQLHGYAQVPLLYSCNQRNETKA